MAKTIPLDRFFDEPGDADPRRAPGSHQELSRTLAWIIGARAAILLTVLNLADPLGLFPPSLGVLSFVVFFEILTVALTVGYLALWWSGHHLLLQLYAQICTDLCLTTLLVAHTHGIESAFVSFYLLIVIYSSLTLGRNGGMTGAALSTILYSVVIAGSHLGVLSVANAPIDSKTLAFRISVHALGFFAVAFLGSHLSLRLNAVQEELEEKIDSIRQLQRLNEHIVSSIRSGLITTDLEGSIAVFNRAAEELTGHKGAVVFDKPVQSVFGEDLWTRIQSTDLFQDARPLRHEDWITLPSGARRYLGFSVSPLMDRQRRLLGYIFSFQDLTEIKRLEEEVRIKDKMAAIGRMAAGIAHEIRNPLTSMRGSVEVLRSHVNLPRSDERLLDILIRESDRLNKFVEDFLRFARPGKYEKHLINLTPLLRDSVTLLKNSSEVRGKHDIILRIDEEPIEVLGNPDQLKQVFWNLAQNGLRAMPTGGPLTVAASSTQDGGAQILFQDAGVGMNHEEKNHLFQPFHSGFGGGSGLGLSIVSQIMEDHRGKISFDSEKGHGTKVTLYLPSQPLV